MHNLPGANDLPEDAKAYNVRYARWDGGPIHIAKGIHTHWDYLAEPRSIYAMAHWYEAQNNRIAKGSWN